MLTDTLIPEAYENAGRSAGLLATLGFGVAFVPEPAGLTAFAQAALAGDHPGHPVVGGPGPAASCGPTTVLARRSAP
jgi:hypothetical protein